MADENNNQFGMGTLLGAFATGEQLRKKRQEEERKALEVDQQANQEKARIVDRSAAISQGIVNDIAGMTSTLDKVQAAEAESTKLRESGNPMDFLALIGQQTLNPGLYTRAGRAKTVAETTQMIGARAQVGSLQQQALADMSLSIDAKATLAKAGLAGAKMDEQVNNELIAAETLRIQTLAGQLQNSNAMQEQKLTQMTDAETRVAFEKSKGQESIDVGGIMITPGMLEKRIQALDERTYQQKVRAAAESKADRELAQQAADRELNTMTVMELQQLQLAGDPRFDPTKIKSVLDAKSAAQSALLERQQSELMFSDFGARVTVPAINEIDRMLPNAPANSELSRSIQQYRNVVGSVVGYQKQLGEAKVPLDPVIASNLDKTIQDQRANVEKALVAEAKQRSGGNRDLEVIFTESYRGNPPPTENVENYAATMLEKNRSLEAIFPPEVSRSIQTKYNEIYTAKMKNAYGIGGMTFDKAQAKREAVQEAIEAGVGQTIMNRTNELFVRQLQEPDNPLYGSMSPETFLGLVRKSDQEGIEAFKKTYGLSDEEMKLFERGEPVPDKPNLMRTDLDVQQTASLLANLDASGLGLGKAYAEWWNTKGPAFAQKVKENRVQAAAQAGTQARVFEEYASQAESDAFQTYQRVVSWGNDSLDTLKDQRYNEMVSFQLNPSHRQAVLLNAVKDLTVGDKAKVMKGFFLPIIDEAEKQGLKYEAINTLIEKQLEIGSPQDPEMNKILRKISKNRSEDIQYLQDHFVRPWWKETLQNLNPMNGVSVSDPTESVYYNLTRSPYSWYQEIVKERDAQGKVDPTGRIPYAQNAMPK